MIIQVTTKNKTPVKNRDFITNIAAVTVKNLHINNIIPRNSDTYMLEKKMCKLFDIYAILFQTQISFLAVTNFLVGCIYA